MRILITGANRGLGLEFVSQYLERGEEIIATCRRPSEAINLQKLTKQARESVTLVKLDVSLYDSIDDAFKRITQQFSSLDMLINNAGIISGGQNRHHSFGKLYTEDITKVFQVNAIGPVLVIEKFFPLLKKGKNAKVVNISSRMGSITLKAGTSTYSYDASKTALNMFSKALAHQLKSEKISVLILHPGWVKTDMGTQRGYLTPTNSVKRMIKIIDAFSLVDTGKFFDWEGNEVPW